MKTKNTKIIISNKKLHVINEVGDEYGTLGVNAFKKIKQSIGDQLKIFKSFIKVSYDNTFGLARDIYVQTKSKGGLIKGLKAAGQNLDQKNKANLKDMDTIIDAQPGASDASTFLALTASPIKGFEGLVNVVTGIDIKPADDKSKYEKQQNKVNLAKSKAAYVNLIYSVYSLENKDLKSQMQNNRNFFSKVDSNYFEQDILKGKKEKEIDLSSKAINVENYRKKSEFIQNIQTIYKISQLDIKLRTKYKIKISTNISINNDVIKVLKLFIAKKGAVNIIKFMANNQLSYDVISFADQIRSLKSRARGTQSGEIFTNAFTHFKERLPESYISLSGNKQLFSTLLIKNNLSLIKEEEEKEKEIDYREFAIANYGAYYIRKYCIVLEGVYFNLLSTQLAIELISLIMIAAKEGNSKLEEINKIKKEVVAEIKLAEDLNEKIKNFESYYNEELDEYKADIVALKGVSKFNASALIKAKSFLEKETDVNKKESAKTEALLFMIEKNKETMSEDESIKESSLALAFFDYRLDEYKKILNKLGLETIKQNITNIEKYYNFDFSKAMLRLNDIEDLIVDLDAKIKEDFNTINTFTNKENEIESVQDEVEDAIGSEEKDSEEKDSEDGPQSDQPTKSGDFKKL
jgi:hypothetical protein